MITPLPAVFCIDSSGKYLGGFAGLGGTQLVQRAIMVPTEVPSGIVDDQGAPITKTEDVPQSVEVDVPFSQPPELPAGAIVVPSAPYDARAIYTGFTVENGQAVGGAWVMP